MIKREAKFTVLFRHWLLAHPLRKSCALELKQTQTDSIPFSAVEEHQIDALIAVKYGDKGLLYKAPDDSRAIKPFDLFYLHWTDAYIVIKYPQGFVIISIESFIGERDSSKRKSLTWERAQVIAFKTVILKNSV